MDQFHGIFFIFPFSENEKMKNINFYEKYSKKKIREIDFSRVLMAWTFFDFLAHCVKLCQKKFAKLIYS